MATQSNGDWRAKLGRFGALLAHAAPLADSPEEAIEAVDAAMAMEPVKLSPEESNLTLLDAAFSHDAFNPKAQRVLDKAMRAVKDMSTAARRELRAALKLAQPAEMAQGVVDFVVRYRNQLARLLGRTNLAALLEGAQEVALKMPPVPLPGLGGQPPASLPPDAAAALLEKLEAMSDEDRQLALYELPAAEQTWAMNAMELGGTRGPLAPLRVASGGEDDVQFPIIEEAVKNLSQRNVMGRYEYDRLETAARQKAFTVAGAEAQETLLKIRDALAANVAEGADLETFREKVLADVEPNTFLSPLHEEQVWRNNVQTAFSDGQMAVLNAPFVREGFPYAFYSAIHDDRVRPNHLALERLGIQGTNIYRIDDPVFQLFRPSWDYSCFLPGTQVQGRFLLGLKSWYDGQAVEITTRSGKRLTVTAHHPVLTPKGFAAANALHKGDYVLSYQGGIKDRLRPNGFLEPGVTPAWADKPRFSSPDERKHDTPAVVEKVFEALAHPLTTCRMPVGPHDLHGEAKFGDGYVDVVGPLWELLVGLEADHAKALSDLGFSAMDSDQPLVSRLGGSHESVLRTDGPASSGMDLIESAAAGFSVRIELAPLRPFCFGLAANIDLRLGENGSNDRAVHAAQNRQGVFRLAADIQLHDSGHSVGVESVSVLTPGDGTGITQDLGQVHAADAQFACELANRFPGVATADEIVNVREFSYSGHVYDLQSEGGWIVADGIFCSNCRCGWTPCTVQFAAERGIKEAIEWLRTGREPSPPAFVPMPSFRPPAGFDRSLSGAPLSIRLSLQPMELEAAFGMDAQGNWHGPTPPGEGWVEVGVGPKGGKVWRQGGQKQAPLGAARQTQAKPTPQLTEPQVGPQQRTLASVRQSLSSSPIKDAKPLKVAKNRNEVSLVTLENGERAVWKPKSGEEPGLRWSIHGDYFRREVGASLTASVLGLDDLVPTTALRREGKEDGSMQEFLPGASNAAKFLPDKWYDGPEDLARAAAFDFLILNTDRHANNWMLQWSGENAKLRLIDNGLSFPSSHGVPEVGVSLFLQKAMDMPVPQAVKSWRGKAPQLQQALQACGLMEAEINLTMERLTYLADAADRGETFAQAWRRSGIKTLPDMEVPGEHTKPGWHPAPPSPGTTRSE